MKRTEKYILFKCGSGSSIVNAMFLRKKETETHVFLSVPPTYKFGVRHNEYNAKTEKWETKETRDVSAQDMKDYLAPSKKEGIPVDDDLPF